MLRVGDLLAPERVKVPLEGLDKESVLGELVDLAAESAGLAARRDEIHKAVWEREEVLSTGIGNGIALPHAKIAGLGTIAMAAGVSRGPVEFGALDAEPVRLLFLVLGPETAADSQVRLLSRISRLLSGESLRQQLVSAKDARRFCEILGEAESAI
ncbi:MAG: PTS transporter subunit EIIA [Gemmatimonadetes bacterium]|nr:PTS transporter subunit EIIA [Gemmatimonadota bacterium]NIO30465.1 PTS transporter subunit EIIA [Gemmatimonadota bacterium]